ncbi:hypothetical protein [Planomicrobium sp. CPCC 101110]|uniref:hypothetical protein n=1 Tax=Planomicrobium sp. CPCC 101110 TaxID=2599619 RepID=UPI0011B4BC70|nr:hypothetical protein [Planomicrobium sp. CPCC 101110]TWT27122.1 hypothetical protein FQV30_00965 [Planomicrobium sp. CPCC 101110]
MKRIFLTLLVIGALLALPILIWFFKDEKNVEVAIIDKTVPDETYREHQGLSWLLNHNRYVDSAGQPYEASEDYFGFVPNESEKDYETRPVPDSLEDKDLIYLADTYGVYEEDLPWQTEEKEPGSSSLLHGGLEMQEWQAIKTQVESNGADLVVEFNTFASPTPENVRRDITDFLALDWSGWSGRHFADLNLAAGEVPQWIAASYEKEEGREWSFEGGGFVLVNDFEGTVVVLSEERGEVGPGGLRVAFTEQGQEHFSLDESPSFGYWFDINKADPEAEVLADYQWNLKEAGTAKLKEAGIPEAFPAVVYQQRNRSNVYYFAGDFVDVGEIPNFYRYAAFSNIRSILSFDALGGESNFYWKTYTPMMKTILANTHAKEPAPKTAQVPQAETDGISYPSRINGQEFEVYKDGNWEPFTIKGVNLGMAKPGTFPGEAAITREEYDSWFRAIGEMNANAIRIYTLHPPAFYEAFARYNASAEEPLYLYHGIWIDEEPLVDTLDAFTPEITEKFQAEIQKVVDVVHGNAKVKKEPGHAYGTYNADISPYVIGWLIGIEWFPLTVAQMAEDYPDLGDYAGDHVYTEDASPMEHWLAQQLDHLAGYELDNYQSMRPLSFTNWPTTDNLDHPAEPNVQEDIATVDPNHIKPKGGTEKVGMFASYHVYPYYPDFLTLEEEYTEFTDHRGEKNNYAGYLKDLNDSHEMPILIAEFGVPASRGKTHENPSGWNQGFLSEKQQGEIAAHLYEDILHEGMLGGLVFTWQDEWFKRTWNTMDYDNPDQRPFWSNAQTNEQQFGLLSFDRHKVKVDGEDDWEDGKLLYEKDAGALRKLAVDSDERYVYLKAEFDPSNKNWWEEQDFNAYFNVRGDKGVSVDALSGSSFSADFHLKIEDEKQGDLLAAGDYDTFYYDYYEKLKMIPKAKEDINANFHPMRLALNKELVRPDTKEVLPFESYETGKLQFGIADPEDEAYDSLNDYYYSDETGILEIRIPWMLLNAKDPSQHEFMGDMRKGGLESSITVEGIGIAASLTNKNGNASEKFDVEQPASYSWEKWTLPETEERLKQSYYILQKKFAEIE